MIRILSAIGRTVIVVAAALSVLAFAIGGYVFARTRESTMYGDFTISGGGQLMRSEAVFALLGAGLGIIVAGAVFGAIATLYDIRDSLRQLAASRPASQPPAQGVRREPRIE